MKLKKLSLNLKVLYVAEFGALACFLPFLTVYFQQKGLTLTQIGVAYALFSLVGVVAQPIWGVITDKYLNKRITLIITMSISAIAVFSLIFANSFYLILLSIVLFLSFQSSIIPVADAFTYEIIETHKEIEYGKIRLLGSLGYALVAMLTGQVVKYLGINSGFFLYAVVILLGVIFVYQIDFQGKSSNKNKTKVKIDDFINLIKEKRFLIFMLAVAVINITLGSNMAYISILIEKTGGDVSNLGTLGFIAAISELPILYFGTKLMKKYGELNLFILGTACFVLRYFLNGTSTSYVTVLMLQLMQCITYTLFLLSSLQYLSKITPPKIRTSAMTFYTAVCSIGNFIGNMSGGVLLEQISIFSLYKILAVVSIIGVAVLLILKKIDIDYNEKEIRIQRAVPCVETK
ncbi:MAG: MFS transporter [Clostridiaceae bacterium]